jgi:hypothetical protein
VSTLKTAPAWFNHGHFGAGMTFSKGITALRACGAALRAPSSARMVEEPISLHRAALFTEKTARDMSPAIVPQVTFDRTELNRILTVYGRMVAAGEWRDYALDFLEEAAVFSIFRRSAEMPLFRIEKRPRLRAKQGQYSVIAAGGVILKRSHELAQVLKIFDKKLLKALAKNS